MPRLTRSRSNPRPGVRGLFHLLPIMRIHSAGNSKKRFVIRSMALLAALLLIAWGHPEHTTAQADPYTLADVQLWISSGVKTARVLRLAQGRCIGFQVDAAAESELRRVGADDTLLNGLRSVCHRLPRVAVAPPPPSRQESFKPPAAEKAWVPSRYSREVLRPLYYGRPTAVTVFGSAVTSEWTGSEPGPWQVDIPGRGTATVLLPAAPARLATYGFSVGAADGLRADFEMYLHQSDLKFLLGGPSLEPFIPLGRTRFRAIVGATGLVGVGLQTLSVEDGSGGAVVEDSLDLTSVLVGGDGRLGLAYHPQPGMWIFAEARYRYLTTVARSLDVNGSQSVSELPWPKLGMRGPSLRIGIGF
jgi:hypothetical protein